MTRLDKARIVYCTTNTGEKPMKLNQESTWPRNSISGQWSKAREELGKLLVKMEKGENRSIEDICREIGISKSVFRSTWWKAQLDAAKHPLGGVYSVKMRRGYVTRMTDEDAALNGKYDLNKGRRHYLRASRRLTTVDPSALNGETTIKFRLAQAQMQVLLMAASPQKRAAEERKMRGQSIDQSQMKDLARLFRS